MYIFICLARDRILIIAKLVKSSVRVSLVMLYFPHELLMSLRCDV